jgi:hypothetical protein
MPSSRRSSVIAGSSTNPSACIGLKEQQPTRQVSVTWCAVGLAGAIVVSTRGRGHTSVLPGGVHSSDDHPSSPSAIRRTGNGGPPDRPGQRRWRRTRTGRRNPKSPAEPRGSAQRRSLTLGSASDASESGSREKVPTRAGVPTRATLHPALLACCEAID